MIFWERNGIVLHHGDCREILPSLAMPDLLLTDPPYGIGWNPKIHSPFHEKIAGDDSEMDLKFIFDMPCEKIIWGAGNFPKQIPTLGRWLCWNKRSSGMSPNSMQGSDFELAWSSAEREFWKYINIVHGGAINDNSAFSNNERRLHPNEKPIRLMKWCIEISGNPQLIVDPFAGSSTTLCAAMLLGRRAIGIEIDERHCESSAERLERILKFGSFAAPVMPSPVGQKSIFE